MKELTRRRLLENWTKAELARRSELNPATIGQIEAGRLLPYDAQLTKIARAFGMDEAQAGQLLKETDE